MTTNLTDRAPRLSDEQLDAMAVENRGVGGDFSTGLRAGGLSARSQLNTLAGTVMDAAGFDGSARRASSREDQLAAQEAASTLTQLKDVDGVRSGVRWAAGTAGQMVPVAGAAVGAGALTGGGALPALAAGTLATVPFELGGQLQRQEADPANAGMTPGERLVAAAPGAVGAAALQNIVPAGMAAKLTGKVAAGGTKQIVGRALLDVPTNAAASGGAELVRQYSDNLANPNAGYNADAALEATKEGAAAGGLFGLAGMAPHALHSAGAAPGKLIGAATDKAKTFIGSAKEKAVELGDQAGTFVGSAKERAGEALDAAKAKVEGIDLGELGDQAKTFVGSAKDKVGELAGQVKTKAEGIDLGGVKDALGSAAEHVTAAFGKLKDTSSALVDRVANGEEFADAKAFVGKQGEALKQAIKLDDDGRVAKATGWARDLASSALNEQQHQQLRAAMTDLTDKANQAVVAGMKRGKDLAGLAKTKIDAFASDLKARREAGTTKKSEDYAGVDGLIKDTVAPFLREHAPHVLEDNKSINTLAVGLRELIGEMSSGKKISSDTALRLLDVTGDKTAALLDQVHAAMTQGKVDGGKADNFFRELNGLTQVQAEHKSLVDVMRSSLVDQDSAPPPHVLSDAAQGLIRWAQAAPKTDGPSPRAQFLDGQVRRELETHFGKNTDKVLAAAQTFVKAEETRLEKARVKVDEEGNPLEHQEQSVEAVPDTKLNTHAVGKDGAGYLNPDDDPGKSGFRPAVTSALEKAQQTNPGARFARFGDELPLDHPAAQQRFKQLVVEGDKAGVDGEAYAHGEIGKYGAIVSETSNNPLKVTSDELAGAKLDGKNHSRSPARLDAEGVGHALDAVKLTEMMKGRAPELGPVPIVGRAEAQRLTDARHFMEGLAAVQEYTGKPVNVPDKTVISKSGMTWGEAQKLDTRTADDKASDAGTQRLVELRKAYAETRDTFQRKEIAKDAAKIKRNKDYAVEREQGQPDDNGVQRDDPTGFEGSIERGIDVGRAALERKTQEAQGALDDFASKHGYNPTDPALQAQLGELVKNLVELNKRMDARTKNGGDLGTGQQEFDPFGPTRQNGRDLDEITGGRGINTDGGETRTDGAGAPSLLGVPPDPKVVAAKKAAFLEKARSGDEALIKEVSTSTDAKGLQRAAEALQSEKSATSTLDAINARLSELVQDPDTAYGMLTKRYSMEAADPQASGPRDLKPTFDYIKRVLGDSVALDVKANIPHAAEFERVLTRHGPEDLIRISVHALNPLSAAHHEALHAFFAKLTDQKNGKIAGVLEKAAESPTTMMQLREFLKDSPEALKQLNNPEERAAYMYQAWAAGKLKLNESATTFFGRVAEMIRSVLGIWSNDQRALHIMDYFHKGEFAKNLREPDVVAQALLAPGRNKAVEAFKTMTTPLRNLGEQFAVAGHQRLRDTGIPALRELADHVKLQTMGEGEDQGFIPASRQERAVRMNALGEKLHGIDEATLNAAMETLQRGGNDERIRALATPEERIKARQAMKEIRATLDEAHGYMTKAGVQVGDLGVGKDYFPRVWDVSYISSHQAEFLAMLDKYVQGGQYKGDPKDLMHKLMASEGAEFTVTDRPGMQHVKPRELAFIDPADAARFVNKNLYQTLNGYLTQAARRAEWARRFGEEDFTVPPAEREPTRLQELMTAAREQGATDKDIEAARNYLRAVDGTLGDTIDPAWRRVQGNLMVYQNVRLLPLAVFSSAVDPMGIMVRGGTMKDAFAAFKRGIMEIPKGFKDNPQRDAATELATALGTIDNAALVHTLGTSFNQGMVGETGRKINDVFFRANLMEQFNSSMRVAATEAAIGFLGRHADGKASHHSTRWLAELGFQPGEVKLGKDGRPLLTEADGLTPAEAGKVRVAINRWVDGAVLRPDSADKPIWMSDPRWALVAHLKQFTFSFHETILKRVAHEMQHGNLAPAYALASYVPIMIAADMVKGMIQGGGSEPSWKEDWEASDYVMSGVERGGLLGVGQFGVDMLKNIREGGTGIGALTGPTIDQLGEAVKTVGGREQFSTFALHSMPANALYAGLLRGGAPAEARIAD